MKRLLIMLALTSYAHAAEFSLYAIKSPKILDWTTVRSLISTAGRGALGGASHQIGHVYVGYKCDGETEVLTGMTSGKGFSSRNDLFNKGYGMSVLVNDNPGHLQGTEEVTKDIEKYIKKGNRMAIMKMQITNEQCLAMKRWHADYAARTPIIYGGVDKRPLLGEGAGCSAYSMSFIEVADVDFGFFNEKFEMTIHMPQSALGGPNFGNRRVGIMSLYGNRTRLDTPTPNSVEVTLYDPNTMYLWINKQYDLLTRGGTSPELTGYKTRVGKMNKTKVINLERL
jgi:hypothetical protein